MRISKKFTVARPPDWWTKITLPGIEVFKDSLIGKGGFGKVYLGQRCVDNQQVAIKVCEKKNKTEQEIQVIRQEYELQKLIRHPNVLETYGYFENESYVVIILEYCAGGDLTNFVKERSNQGGCPSLQEISQIMKGIFMGLGYIHEELNAIHRDIKPRKLD